MSALLIAEAMRVSDLARNEGVTLPTMTQIVGRMEAAGWVSRAAPSGTYNNLIRITPEGAAPPEQQRPKPAPSCGRARLSQPRGHGRSPRSKAVSTN